jgi:glycosyltransferase involved in cell wall biosynthesis
VTKEVVLVGPESWFEIPVIARSGEAGSVELTLVNSDGECPLSAVRLDELRAVHQTFGAWWQAVAGDGAGTALEPGTYDRFLSESRALVRRQAEAVLASAVAIPTERLLAFPGPDHVLLAGSRDALNFLRSFLALSHSSSLTWWARTLTGVADIAGRCRREAWLRLVLQKVAVEDELPEALACLREVYRDNVLRRDLLGAEADLLEQSGLTGLRWWAETLGLDRPQRSGTAFNFQAPSIGREVAHRPDVTVLVPSYCHAEYIESALESIRAQTYSRFEILVVDDRSPDKTVERAARVEDPRLRIEVNEANLGQGDSVMNALSKVATPYVALLNSDDIFHAERLERCRDAMERSPDVQMVATRLALIDAYGRRLSPQNVSRLFDGRKIADWVAWFDRAGLVPEGADLLAELLERNFLATSSNIVCRTEFLRRQAASVRGLNYCFDWQLFLAAAAVRGLVVLQDELLGYRLHGSNTVWFDEERRIAYVLEVNRVLAETLRRVGDVQPAGVDARDLSPVIDLLVNHAAKHSDANGLALCSSGLLEPRKWSGARSSALGAFVRTIASTNGSTPGQVAAGLHSWMIEQAARAIAEVSQEEATIAQSLRTTLECQGRSLHETEAELRRQAAERQRAEAEQARVEATLRRELDAMSQERLDLAVRGRSQAEELTRLRSSPEWVVGDAVWNRARLSRIGRPASRTLRSLRDRRNRLTLSFGRAARAVGLTRPRAVVAACWNFPIYSQTFVYQEIQALASAGLDYRVFCCGTNSKSELHPAFESLWRSRVVLESDWAFNRRDLEYFRRTRPDRVDALLGLLARETGRSEQALLSESIVMMGFTFARHVELSGAEYLHTYFFYDQSFLALMAAYLLKLPRGVTAYADHMLSDYAFKCVPLHLELADIVVATSRRIKEELNGIGGGRFDAKIIVKPNGIDTTRFPYVDAASRLRREGVPELIAVNRIEPKKGLIHLVEAMGRLKARGIAARLSIVGGADQTPAGAECLRQLKAKIDELQLADRVVLRGVMKQPEFIPLLGQARLFVAPYVEVSSGDKDGIPTAILEAMSSGLPIVATDAGSIEEVIRNGVEGLIVPQRNPDGLADAIARLLNDEDAYVGSSDAARSRALSDFDIQVTERRLHERIHECLNHEAGAGA